MKIIKKFYIVIFVSFRNDGMSRIDGVLEICKEKYI